MRYIDSGKREPDQALGTWLAETLVGDVVELRWQTGYYGDSALNWFYPLLERLATSNGIVRLLVGSNELATSGTDVAGLFEAVGLPRANAALGVVAFDNAFFHPKTVHVGRSDGSQAAYVGSANLTGSGISSLHVEAGLLLDTRTDDSETLLADIASGIDRWFFEQRDGIDVINALDDIDALVTASVLGRTQRPHRRAARGRDGGGRAGGRRPRLSSLLPLRGRPGVDEAVHEEEEGAEDEPVPVAAGSVEQRQGYPDYIHFAPGATSPTTGAEALSGMRLKSGAVGLVVRLNRDSGRHFLGRGGTANVSIPVVTANTFRFGVMGTGTYPDRARVEFPLRLRYCAPDHVHLVAPPAQTNVMLYGYLPREPGHRDIRLVLPADVRRFAEQVQDEGLVLPGEDHPAILEWPTPQCPEFRITFLEPESPEWILARKMLERAQSNDTAAGGGACLLFEGLSPEWDLPRTAA